jgi:NADH-quinone oxidoreductase subunit L
MSQETLQTLTWLIPAGPLLVFFLIVLFTRNNRTLSWVLAWAGVIGALVLSWTIAFHMFGTYLNDDISHPHELLEHPVQIASSIDWLPIGDYANNTWLQMGVSVDPLTAVMLFMVSLAVVMIFVYSVGYHNYGKPPGTVKGTPNHGKEEPMFSRFFALMSLFAGAMLLLVVSDNLLMLFIGWEIMGFCSYSLIGFWYARDYHLKPGDIPHIPPGKRP